MAELFTYSWLLLLLVITLFSGIVAIGAGIIALLGARFFGPEGSTHDSAHWDRSDK